MKAKYLLITLSFLVMGNSKVNAQIKSQPEDIELIANKDNDERISEKLRIEYTCDSTTKTGSLKFKVTVTVKSIARDLSIKPKVYSYSVRANSVEKDFNKEMYINNIILSFSINDKAISNAVEVKSKLYKIFTAAIEEVKHEVDLIKSDEQVRKNQNEEKS